MPLQPDLPAVRAAFTARAPTFLDPPAGVASHAAVALILHPSASTPGGFDLLFIERAQDERDPWSGQMAFPGGRREDIDGSIDVTVVREVEEEIGARLAQPLGRLDDYDARTGSRKWPLIVSPFVFAVESKPTVRLSAEVASVVWIPLATLLDPTNKTQYRWTKGVENVVMPGIRHDRHVIWGMTYKILGRFVETLGEKLP